MRRLSFVPLAIAVIVLFALNFLGREGAQGWHLLALYAQSGAALAGVGYCVWALRLRRGQWQKRRRAAWSCIALSGVCFAIGTLASTRRDPAEALIRLSATDFWWIVQQPLLWAGLFLLAWRGERLSLMRLLSDTLIVVLAALVLSWGVLMERLLTSEQFLGGARLVAIYYPMCDIALLFCVLILLSNVRDRPAMARASWWIFGGVMCLIGAGSFSSYFFLARQAGLSPWIDAIQGLTYPLLGVGALIQARHWVSRKTLAAKDPDAANAAEATNEAPSEATVGAREMVTVWERTLGTWHRSAMVWLPTAATLGVSGVLVWREMRGGNPETIRRLLPVLALLLAIVARQMITLWDNLRLSEQLRVRASDLEQNVDDRTRHLTTLHDITSTLNTSLDKRTVLRITLEQTIGAVGAQGGGIWLRDAKRDIYALVSPATETLEDEWTLVHWHGFDELPTMPDLLRELSIYDAQMQSESPHRIALSSATRGAMQTGVMPPKAQLIQVPVQSQGELLGVMALARTQGNFSYADRALVESVALEAGTALQNARLYSEAAERANRDSVTHLLNHRAVQERLHETLARSKRSGARFSIVMMDLNNFKFFNDTYGHPVGDDVLRNVASALKEASRDSDVLGRYGGDEFIMLLPDTDAAGTLEACARIQTALDARYLEPVKGTKLPISISFGWSSFPADGENVLDLLTAADQHLYDHKRGNASRLISRIKNAEQEELRRLKNRAVGGSFGVLNDLVNAIDNKDHYTRHHSEEVTYLSLLVARELGYDEAQLEAVRISGLLHDVGKIAVPDDVLRHPGKLNREQWELMQRHPTFGAMIVKDVPHLEAVGDGIKYHHEKWDGSGYPEKLAGEKIPKMGRLLAMGDCYSALTTDRPYRKGWTPQAALEEIAKCAGTHFDPELCAVFLRVMERELELDGDTSDYSARIADDFGQLARMGQTKSGDPVVGREPVPLGNAG